MRRLKEIAISVVEEQSEYRPLYLIAQDIKKDWKHVNFGAKPYLDAMSSLDSMTDNYGADPASMIVAYFLSNASTWKGETAKRIKVELNDMLKGKKKKTFEQEIDLQKVSQMKRTDPLDTQKLNSKFSKQLTKGVGDYEEKLSPIIKRQVEYLRGVLPYLKKRPQDAKMVQDMLDKLEKEGLTPLSDKQLSMVSFLLSKVLKEDIQRLKEDVKEFIGQDITIRAEDAPGLEKYDGQEGRIINLEKNVDNQFAKSTFSVKFRDGQVKSVSGMALSLINPMVAPRIPVGLNEKKNK
jgi:hypothetical protein